MAFGRTLVPSLAEARLQMGGSAMPRCADEDVRRGPPALTCPTSPEQLQPLWGSGNLLRDPNWLLVSGLCRSRCWLGNHNRIGNCLRNIDGFRAGLMSTNHARPP